MSAITNGFNQREYAGFVKFRVGTILGFQVNMETDKMNSEIRFSGQIIKRYEKTSFSTTRKLAFESHKSFGCLSPLVPDTVTLFNSTMDMLEVELRKIRERCSRSKILVDKQSKSTIVPDALGRGVPQTFIEGALRPVGGSCGESWTTGGYFAEGHHSSSLLRSGCQSVLEIIVEETTQIIVRM